MNYVAGFCMFLATWLSISVGLADTIGSGFCKELHLEDIPVGDFQSPQIMPMDEMRITQHYNNHYSDGWCSVGGSQPPATSSVCDGQVVYYGHDGIDLHPKQAAAGATPIYSVHSGKVIASHKKGTFPGWGESLVIATRTNPYSEEILTVHYHHLYYDTANNTTSRLYNACETVGRGAEIAREGGTPNWPTHLHLSVKRWSNIQEIQDVTENSPGQFYGSGYVYGETEKLAQFLDPESLLYDNFAEFTQDIGNFPTWQWSQPYALESRYRGWFFGNYDGSYGVEELVPRRLGAKLIKQALELETITISMVDYFYDVAPDDPDFPYINTLSQWPEWVPVINPEHSCFLGGPYFCPDQHLSRAEAIKMIVAGFFPEEFLDLYNNWVWKIAAPLAKEFLSYFNDVPEDRWYTPYVYFAWQKGLTGVNKDFLPNQSIRGGELAKWLVLAYQMAHQPEVEVSFCGNMSCLWGFYCEESSQSCQAVPACVPREGLSCPLGGGYTSSSGQEETPPDNSGQECTSGEEELVLCPDHNAGAYRLCLSNGIWSPWDPPCFGAPDGEGGGGEDHTGGAGGSGGSGGADTSNEGAGGNENTGGNNGTGGDETEPPPCQVTYSLSPSGASCNPNLSASGSPTLCLETANQSEATTSWRLCKQGQAFQNSFTYQLLDQNHLSQFLGVEQFSAPGAYCTGWSTADFSYLTQDGPINGAGLIVEVKSPSGCTSPACTYYSGITTFYRDCE
jgi:hypothetical protein